MNSDYDKQLEAGIGRELKNLPELTAPDSLVNRVLATLERRSRVPWYRRSWQKWPAAPRWASFAALLVLFGGLCYAGWKMSHADPIVLAMHRMGNWFSALNMIGNTLSVIVNSGVLALKKLGTGFMAACLFALALAYAMCLGLGTIYVRLGFANTGKTPL
jgi:hypothetical protein